MPHHQWRSHCHALPGFTDEWVELMPKRAALESSLAQVCALFRANRPAEARALLEHQVLRGPRETFARCLKEHDVQDSLASVLVTLVLLEVAEGNPLTNSAWGALWMAFQIGYECGVEEQVEVCEAIQHLGEEIQL